MVERAGAMLLHPRPKRRLGIGHNRHNRGSGGSGSSITASAVPVTEHGQQVGSGGVAADVCWVAHAGDVPFIKGDPLRAADVYAELIGNERRIQTAVVVE